MNPLAELAVLIGQLCMFLFNRLGEVLTTVALVMGWLFVPRALELYQYASLFFSSNLEKTEIGRDFETASRRARINDSEWYNYFFYSEDFVGHFIAQVIFENVMWVLALPTWLGLCMPYSFIVIVYYTKATIEYSINRNDCKFWLYKSMVDQRFIVWSLCIIAIADVICMPFVLIASLHPIRGNVRERYFQAYAKHYRRYSLESTANKSTYRDESDLEKNQGDFPSVWSLSFRIAAQSILDFAFTVVGILFIVITPSMYISMYQDICRAVGDYYDAKAVIDEAYKIVLNGTGISERPLTTIASYTQIQTRYKSRKQRIAGYIYKFNRDAFFVSEYIRQRVEGPIATERLMRARSDAIVELRDEFCHFLVFSVLLESIPKALADWASVVLLPFALVDPMRSGPLRDELATEKAERARIMESLLGDYQNRIDPGIDAYVEDLHESGALPANEDDIPLNMSFSDTDAYKDMYGGYNLNLRLAVIRAGLMAITDLLVLPLFLPLVITQYRWIPLYKKHIRDAGGLTAAVLLKTVEQTACLFLDLVFLLPLTALVFATRVRWRPLRDSFREVNFVMSLPLTLKVHAQAWSCLCMLIGDIICFPGFLLLQITQYRAGTLNYLFSHPYGFHTLTYFQCIVVNVGVLIFDAVIVWPFALCALLLSLGARAEVLLMIFGAQAGIKPPAVREGVSMFRWLGDDHPDCYSSPTDDTAGAQLIKEEVEVSAKRTIYEDLSSSSASPTPVVGASEVEKRSPDKATDPFLGESGGYASFGPEAAQREGDEQLNIFWTMGCVPHYQRAGVMSFSDWVRDSKSLKLRNAPHLSPEELSSRLRIIVQFVFSFVDILSSCAALVVMATLWRAPKLLDWLYTWLHELRVHFSTPYVLNHPLRHFDEPTRNQYFFPYASHDDERLLTDALWHFETILWSWKRKVLCQFVYLLRDVLGLPFLAVVAGTLYRLPFYLIDMFSTLSAKPLADEIALFTTTKVTYEFPVRGGPQVDLELKCNPQVLGEGQGEAFPRNVVVTGPVKLHVFGSEFWRCVADAFGVTAASIGKSMLPLRLKEGEDAHLAEFRSQLSDLLLLNTAPGHRDETIKLRVNLPAGSTKRSSFLKNMKKLLCSQFTVQLQAKCSVDGGDRKERVLSRMTLSSLAMGDILEKSVVDGNPADSTPEVTYYDRKGVFTMQETSLGSQAPIVDTEATYDDDGVREDAWATDDGFIDAFFMTTLLHFFNVMHDLSHAGLLVLVLLAPWRMWRLFKDLTAPKHLADYVQVMRLVELFNLAEQHFLDYYRALMPVANATGKGETVFALSGWYWRWHIGYTRPVVERFRNMHKVEKTTLKPYHKLTRKVIKAMEDIDVKLPGVNHINALFSERMKLQLEMISVPALKAGLYSEAVSRGDDDFWSEDPESRPHAILDMLLNVRTANNRTLLLQNRQHVNDNLRLLEQSCELAQRRKLRAKAIKKHHAKSSREGAEVDDDEPMSMSGMDQLKEEDKLAAEEAQEGYWLVEGKEIKVSSSMTVVSQSLLKTKTMIAQAAYHTFRDVAHVLVCIFLFLTVIRFFPLLRDLRSAGTVDPGSYMVQFYIRKHVGIFIDDASEFVRFIVLFSLVVVTVFSLPSTLIELPQNAHDFAGANRFLSLQLAHLGTYFCQLIAELCQCVTCWRLVNIAFFFGLTPGICVTDTLFPLPPEVEERRIEKTMEEEREWMNGLKENSRRNLTQDGGRDEDTKRLIPFWGGLIIWGALAFCAGWSSFIAIGAGKDSDGADSTDSSSLFALGLYLGLACFSLLMVLYSWNRKTIWKPVSLDNANMNPFPILSSAHFSALLTGPLEALQLSAVICYFLWPTGEDPSDADWASRLLLWGDYSSSAKFHTSMILSLVTGVLWAIMISLPAVIVAMEGGDDNCTGSGNCCDDDCCEDEDCCEDSSDQSTYGFYNNTLSPTQRAHRTRSSPLYSMLMHLINRFFNVLFIATLLRPLSCMQVEVTSGETIVSASVLTTTLQYANGYAADGEDLSTRSSDIIMCGGDSSAANYLSGVCLMYYIVTTLSMHADDGDAFSVSVMDLSTQNYARFSPSYAMIMRALQLAAVSLVMLGAPLYSSTEGSSQVLGAVFVVSTLMAFTPALFLFRGTQSCSTESLSLFRGFSSLCVMWTCIVCLIRHSNASSTVSENSAMYLFVGWGVLLCVGAILAYASYAYSVYEWRKAFRNTPLYVAVTKLFASSTDQSLTVEERQEAVLDSHAPLQAGGAAAAAGTDDKSTGSDERAYALAGVRAGLTEARRRKLMAEAENATSMVRLAVVVAKFEDSILVERLDPGFLMRRTKWKTSLLNARQYPESHFANTALGGQYASWWTSEGLESQTDQLVELCNELTRAVQPQRHLLHSSRRELLDLFTTKNVPMDVTIGIMSYLLDAEKLTAEFLPVLLTEITACAQNLTNLMNRDLDGGHSISPEVLLYASSRTRFLLQCIGIKKLRQQKKEGESNHEDETAGMNSAAGEAPVIEVVSRLNIV